MSDSTKREYLIPDVITAKPAGAIERLRELSAAHGGVLGAEAIEFKPGAVVLLVATFPPFADPDLVKQLHECMGMLADELQSQGVRGVCVALPEALKLNLFEIPESAR